MKELLFVIIGFLLGLVPSWYIRKRRLKTHWCALKAEIAECKAKAETLLRDEIMSPLYRLPVMTYHVSFPVLLADGGVDQSEFSAIGRFFGMAGEINRGLDNAAEMRKIDDSEKLRQEFERNCLKAEELIKLYDEAIKVVDSKNLHQLAAV